ncbi:hypothetical protein [Streptomyces sp. NPDC007083]
MARAVALPSFVSGGIFLTLAQRGARAAVPKGRTWPFGEEQSQ